MDDPHALTIAQAAEALGVSERTVWRYLAAGRLPGETTGPPGSQRTLIPRGAVEGLRASRGPDPDAAAVRAERDRLVAELAGVQSERDRWPSGWPSSAPPGPPAPDGAPAPRRGHAHGWARPGPGRGGRSRAGRAQRPSSRLMISCWISLVPSVIEASLASR